MSLGDRLGWPTTLLLWGSALVTVTTWLAFARKIPALAWTDRAHPHMTIAESAWRIGPLTDTMLLLLLLLGAYIVLAWVVWTSDADLPGPLVLTTAGASALLATRTYMLFAEDLHDLYGHVWNYLMAGVNPYVAALAATPNNPYQSVAGWPAMPYVYGPAGLFVGMIVMRLVGPDIVADVLVTKYLMVGTLWLLGGIAWRLAQARGAQKPMATVALVLWNPLLLAHGIMTPHLDLLMATVLLAGLLAWAGKREAEMFLALVLSVTFKFITVILGPAVLLSFAVTGAFRGRAGVALRPVVLGTGVIVGLGWLGIWEPFLRHGLPRSLELHSNTALIPNLLTALQASGVREGLAALDLEMAAERLRWWAFVPYWALGTVGCILLARKHANELPYPLLEVLALLLLGYHVLFTLNVLPWHFITALVLCLVATSRVGLWAALLVTSSAILTDVQHHWVWAYFDPLVRVDYDRISWILGSTLLIGPASALLMLCCHTWAQYRASAVQGGGLGIGGMPGEGRRPPKILLT